MLLSSLRKNHLVYISFLLYFLTLVVVLLELDRQYYQEDKRQIIFDHFDEIFPLDRTQMGEKSRIALTNPMSERGKVALEDLRTTLDNIVTGELSIFEITLEDKNKEVIVQARHDKVRAYNNFKNSLFLKNFSREASFFVTDRDAPNQERVGKIVVLYTTPTNFRPIEQLTIRYRLLALGLLVMVTMIYSYALTYLILPMKRVLNSLEGSRGGNPQLLPNPKSLLERAYNNLARDALLTKLSSQLQELVSNNKQIERNQMLSQGAQIVTGMFAAPACAVFEGRPEGESLMRWRPLVVSIASSEEPHEQGFSDRCRRLITRIQEEIGIAGAQEIPSVRTQDFGDTGFRDLAVWQRVLTREEIPSYPCLIVFVYRSNLSEDHKEWATTTFSRIAEELRRSLEHLEVERQRLFEEKSEANINLSRNLGHDLTNIIATSKIDLMTVNRLLELSPEELKGSAEKEQIFKQSLANLLNNTKFLQEIVNIYRAFAFVKRPMYESVDLNKLVKEILDLFLMSLSRSITIRAQLDAKIPPCQVELRLFKLAVFNLLTNAIEAIKKASAEYDLRGEIILTTEYLAEQGAVEVRIADNGPGIRNSRGEKATPEEIEEVFYLGFTTKQSGEGEGLGLHWVRTIVEDFHEGQVKARNRTDPSGAEFIIRLPVNARGKSENSLAAPVSTAEASRKEAT